MDESSFGGADDEASLEEVVAGRARLAKSYNRVRTEDVWSDAESFEELGVSDVVLRGLSAAGYIRPSPVQKAVIPRGRMGGDLIVQAKSGTGKTVVFAVIALEAIAPSKARVQALVLAPTRELAVQTAEVISAVGRFMEGVGCVALIGGLPAGDQERKLKQGPAQIVVGTPGRTRSFLESGSLGFSLMRLVVLDEADRLLTAPSLEGDTREIIGYLPEDLQVVAVSATYEPGVLHEIEALMDMPERLDLTRGLGVSLRGVRQYYRIVQGPADSPVENPDDIFALKADGLVGLLGQLRGLSQAVVFCNDQHGASWLAERLTAAGFPSAFISGAMDQRDRLKVMADVRHLRVRAVVSTDLVARGVDLDLVNLVVNMDVPPEAATYMHRVGRTGRFGTLGLAVSFLTEEELLQLKGHLEEVKGGEVQPLPDQIPDDVYAVELEDPRELEALAALSLAPRGEAPPMKQRPLRPRPQPRARPEPEEEDEDEQEGEEEERMFHYYDTEGSYWSAAGPSAPSSVNRSGFGWASTDAEGDDDRSRWGETSSVAPSEMDPLRQQRRGYYGAFPPPFHPAHPWASVAPRPPYPHHPLHRYPHPYRPVPYYQQAAYGMHPYYAPYGPPPHQQPWPGLGPSSAAIGPENEPPQAPKPSSSRPAPETRRRAAAPSAGPDYYSRPPADVVEPTDDAAPLSPRVTTQEPPPWAVPPHRTGLYGGIAPHMQRPLPGPSAAHTYGHLGYRQPYASGTAPHVAKYYSGVRPHSLSSYPPFAPQGPPYDPNEARAHAGTARLRHEEGLRAWHAAHAQAQAQAAQQRQKDQEGALHSPAGRYQPQPQPRGDSARRKPQ